MAHTRRQLPPLDGSEEKDREHCPYRGIRTLYTTTHTHACPHAYSWVMACLLYDRYSYATLTAGEDHSFAGGSLASIAVSQRCHCRAQLSGAQAYTPVIAAPIIRRTY